MAGRSRSATAFGGSLGHFVSPAVEKRLHEKFREIGTPQGLTRPQPRRRSSQSTTQPSPECATAMLRGVAVPPFAKTTSILSDPSTRRHVPWWNVHGNTGRTPRTTGQPRPATSLRQFPVRSGCADISRTNVPVGASVPHCPGCVVPALPRSPPASPSRIVRQDRP